jgi:uncharacterized protein YlbG (UPF0298 family)
MQAENDQILNYTSDPYNTGGKLSQSGPKTVSHNKQNYCIFYVVTVEIKQQLSQINQIRLARKTWN